LTQAELRSLLLDCLKLWNVQATVSVDADTVSVETAAGAFTVQHADPELRPVRWFWQTPERREAGRQPRAAPSIVALLSALRNAIGGDGGATLRIGGAAG